MVVLAALDAAPNDLEAGIGPIERVFCSCSAGTRPATPDHHAAGRGFCVQGNRLNDNVVTATLKF